MVHGQKDTYWGLALPRPNTDLTDHVPFRIRLVADHVTYSKLLFTYTRQTRDYKSADITALNDALTFSSWDTAYTILTRYLQTYWETLLLDVCKSYIPNNTVTIKPRDKPLMSIEVRPLIRNVTDYMLNLDAPETRLTQTPTT
jgi:hypothetical protein